MRLFGRKKESPNICPRCSQMVSEDEGMTCPMCGWDLREAYRPADGEREPDATGARRGPG